MNAREAIARAHEFPGQTIFYDFDRPFTPNSEVIIARDGEEPSPRLWVLTSCDGAVRFINMYDEGDREFAVKAAYQRICNFSNFQ